MPRGDFKKALVTGGAGFIGSSVARRLLESGLEVVVVDDLSMGKKTNVPEKARFVEGSVFDANLLSASLEGVDVVFHNAARVSIRNSFDDVLDDTETNVLGTVNVLRAGGKAGIRRFVYASSMAVYGEDAALPLKEGSSLDPISPYGAGKLAGEIYTRRIAEYYGFDGVTLRYFNTYGPGQTLTPYVGVMTIFIRRLLAGEPPVIFGTGDQVRDFVYVGDVAEANVRAMTMAGHGAVVNVGTGRGTTVNELARMLSEKTGGPEAVYAAPPPGEPSDSIADVTACGQVLGFVPFTTIEEKMDEVIEWNRLAAGGPDEGTARRAG